MISSDISETYDFDIIIENQYINFLCEIGFLKPDFDELWTFIYKSKIDLVHENDYQCVEIYDELLYDSAFSSISLKRYLNHSYQECNSFEDGFKDFINTVVDVDTGSTASANVTKKTENKKAENKKTGKNINLKNLLNQRLKRLKLEEDTIDCEQLDSTKSLIFTCKLCGLESKRKRRLFITHVLPLHIKNQKKSAKFYKKRKPKIKVSFRSEIDKKYICPDLNCDKRFYNRGNRKRHMIYKHYKMSDRFKLKCDICDQHDTCFTHTK